LEVTRTKRQGWRFGAVSFLNTRPLIRGLADEPGVEVVCDVPARLPALLDERLVDVTLAPVVDMVAWERSWKVVSDACIGCDGETMTVRVFSKTPPDGVRRLWADPASHTSVVLAKLIWQRMYDCRLEVCPLADADAAEGQDAVLLIGDKVITSAPYGFTYQTDLGGLWKSLTGLPFVFAVWAARREMSSDEPARLLSEARDRGVRCAATIAETDGPKMGWPPAVARAYLTRNLSFTLTARHREGMRLFLEMACVEDIAPPHRELVFA